MAAIFKSDTIHLLKLKDERAYRNLYDAYSPSLFGLIKQVVKCQWAAEEILQKVFLKIWLNMDKYSEEKASLFTWMFSIARNEAIDYLRSKQARENFLTSSIEEVATKETTFTDKRLARFDLLNCSSELPYKERAIMELYKIGFTVKEIGQLLRLPEGSVKTMMRAAYRKLRIALTS